MSEMIAADQRLAELAQKMKYHDWYYDYSDDHRVWRAGEARISEIRSEMAFLKNLGLEEQVQALWEQHCPWSKANKS